MMLKFVNGSFGRAIGSKRQDDQKNLLNLELVGQLKGKRAWN